MPGLPHVDRTSDRWACDSQKTSSRFRIGTAIQEYDERIGEGDTALGRRKLVKISTNVTGKIFCG